MIFELFGVTLPAFQITGGLIVFLIGFHMLQGNHSSVQHPSEEDKQKSREAALDVDGTDDVLYTNVSRWDGFFQEEPDFAGPAKGDQHSLPRQQLPDSRWKAVGEGPSRGASDRY